MKEDLCSFALAKLAKEKGFNVISYVGFGAKVYDDKGNIKSTLSLIPPDKERIDCPTLALLQKWLWNKHYIFVSTYPEILGSDELGFCYRITYLPKDKQQAKRRCVELIEIESFKEGPGSYIGAWNTPTEALEVGLTESLKLINHESRIN